MGIALEGCLVMYLQVDDDPIVDILHVLIGNIVKVHFPFIFNVGGGFHSIENINGEIFILCR